MFVTDSQVHIWGPNTPEHPWSAFALGLHSDNDIFGADDLIEEMDKAGVDRAVIVTPSWFGSNAVSLQAVVDYPGRFGVMGTIDFRNSDPNSLRTWRQQQGMLGIRLMLLNPELRSLFDEGKCEPFFAAAEESLLPVMMLASTEPSMIIDIAKRYPDLKIIVDHLNLPAKVRDDELGPAIENLLPLSEHGNIAVKLSALPLYVSEEFPYPSLRPRIRRVIEMFGVGRCMWGSDVTRLQRSYIDCVRLITGGNDFLSPHEQEMLLDGTISKWLEWPRED